MPINTLRKLPANGIVIDAVLYPHSQLKFLDAAEHPPRNLPLRLADATLRERWEGQPHPGIVDFSIGARINGYGIELHVYLDTSHPSHRLRTMAQRELNHLVIPPPH